MRLLFFARIRVRANAHPRFNLEGAVLKEEEEEEGKQTTYQHVGHLVAACMGSPTLCLFSAINGTTHMPQTCGRPKQGKMQTPFSA